MGVIGRATTSQTNDNLNHFAAWVNRYCDSHLRHDAFAPGALATPHRDRREQARRLYDFLVSTSPTAC